MSISEGPNSQETGLSKTAASGISGINKRFLKPLRIIILILAVVFALFLTLRFISSPYDKTNCRFTNITVEEGESDESVAQKLADNGIVADPSRFCIVSRLSLLTNFKPGTYYLSPSMDSVAIARIMVKGLTTSNGFTIPAGYTVEHIASSLSRDGFVDRDKFIAAASSDYLHDVDIIGNDISGPEQIEGFLLPDEYNINSDADEMMIILTMLDRFSNFYNEDFRARTDELDMSIREILVIASVIEMQTKVDSERAQIAGVIHNRINLEMTDEGEIPDIPLCCPGKESIMAALYPAETEDTYYVLSDKLDGSHVFTSDEKEYKELTKAYHLEYEKKMHSEL